MSTYYINEASFEVPDGFEDRSLTLLQWRTPDGRGLQLTVQWLADDGAGAATAAERALAEIAGTLADHVVDDKTTDEDGVVVACARFSGEDGVTTAVHAFAEFGERVAWVMAMVDPPRRPEAERLVRTVLDSFTPRDA